MNRDEHVPWEELDALLVSVERPARYTGGEIHAIRKHEGVQARIALCFPDLYEIAESYLGFKLLYDIVNRQPNFAAERVYAVAPDLEHRMRERGTLLWSLEQRRTLRSFDIVGFTLQYELAYPTILAMLELGGVTLRTAQRREDEPLVIGGGSNATNPEPIAPFFDAFLLGDGEEAIIEMLQVAQARREHQLDRMTALLELAKIPGVYVPSHFQVTYEGLRVSSIAATSAPQPPRPRSRDGVAVVRRRTLASLETVPYPLHHIQPNVRPVHDRFSIEIQRGCSRGCRFCQAGMIQRPVRQRSPDTVLGIANAVLCDARVDTIGLLSLSAGDYAPLNQVLGSLLTLCEPERVGLSLPSLRTETLTREIASRVNAVSSSSFTVAPEAGSDRLRRVINKTNSDSDLIRAVEAAVGAGARVVKLYFMIGLPSEDDTDSDAISELAKATLAAARRINRASTVTVAVSTFIPKAHTPFQWERQMTVAETVAKHKYLRDRLRHAHIALRYHDPEQSLIEGVLARGDRQLANAIEAAMRAGCRLDGWSELFDASRWRGILQTTLAPLGLTAQSYLEGRDLDGLLAWDHLHAGVLKKFLRRERDRAFAQCTTHDCARTGRCYACGACDRADPYLDRRHPAHSATDAPLLAVLHGVSAGTPAIHDDVAKAVEQSLDGLSVAAALEGAPACSGLADPHAPSFPEAPRFRLRWRYEKVGPAVHLSQLEATSHVLRAIRHARLPVLFSQGFTPRPRVSFSPACPTGIESAAEYVDCLCTVALDPAEWIPKLNAHLSSGLRLLTAERLAPHAPSVGEQTTAMLYAVTVPHADSAQARNALGAFLAQTTCELKVLRKTVARTYDARRTVLQASMNDNVLSLTIAFSPAGALKLREVLAAIVGSSLAAVCKIRKVELIFGEPCLYDGEASSPTTSASVSSASAPI